MYDAFGSLTFDRPEQWILRITLSTPGKLNAVGHEAHGQLAEVWRAIDRDPETRVVVVRGADGAFSAGGDLALVEDIARDAETRRRVFHEARDLVYNIVDCSKPIVAAIEGPCVGAGLAVALLADISVAAPSARIVDGHTRLGVAAGDHAVHDIHGMLVVRHRDRDAEDLAQADVRRRGQRGGAFAAQVRQSGAVSGDAFHEVPLDRCCGGLRTRQRSIRSYPGVRSVIHRWEKPSAGAEVSV